MRQQLTGFGGKLAQMHWLLIAYVLAIACIGFAMMYSAAGGSINPWAIRQLYYFSFASLLLLVLAVVPSSVLMRYAYLLFVMGIVVLLVVKTSGVVGKGAKRWVDVGGNRLQPSELMKIAVILALARYYHSINPNDVNKLLFLIPPLLIVGVPAYLIYKQPNLGTASILVGIGVLMCYMAGVRVRLRYLLLAAALAAAAVPVAWKYVLHDYQKQRVMTFLHPEDDPQGAGYNIMQSVIAIGSGGVFGKGYMQGSQGQLDFLPEKHTDFIFTMLAEEFGFFGCMVVLALYMVIIGYGVMIYLRCRHRFGSLLAIGVSSMLFVHIVINTAMVMGLIPVVGVPLPMLSYGGSIMISMMMGFGLMQNAYVHRDANLIRPSGVL